MLSPPATPEQSPEPPISPLGPQECEPGQTVLLVIAPEGFNDSEYLQPRAVLEAAGCRVVVASLSVEVAVGMRGTQVEPDVVLAEVDGTEYDAVLFIGGSGADVYWDDAQAHRVAREAVNQDRVVGAICIAPVILARAGVLEGRDATVFSPSSLCPELEARGATCSFERVQRDGRIVTGNGPEAAQEFAEVVIRVLQEP
jgi:protease I